MSDIRVVVMPYELGRLPEGVGRGPDHLLERGARDALASAGATVRTDVIELADRFGASGVGDVDAAFEPAPGVAWFDAHADFRTPETSIAGYFDGMSLAVLTGGAWQGLLATVPGTRPVPEPSVVLAGARDFDSPEEARLRASQIAHLTTRDLRSPETVVEALQAVVPEITGLYLHLDLDVLDVEVARVNVFSAPGGLDGDQLDGLVEAIMRTFPVRAVSLTAYDPECDAEGRVPPIALRVLRTIARHARSPGRVQV